LERRYKSGVQVIAASEAITRSERQRELGGYLPELPHTGDLEMWLRFAVYSDVGFIRHSEQAYKRLHPASMSQTRFAGRHTDLLHRMRAFQHVLVAHAEEIPARDRLDLLVRQALATESMWLAIAALDVGGGAQSTDFSDFAKTTWPEIETTLPARVLAARRSGRPLARLTPPGEAIDAFYRARSHYYRWRPF
jgi:hypothetical protein